MLWVFLLEDWYMNLRDLESGSDLHSKSADFEWLEDCGSSNAAEQSVGIRKL